MPEPYASTKDHDEPAWYEIRLKGHLGEQWSTWFEGLNLTLEDNGDTLLTGPVDSGWSLGEDRAASRQILAKIDVQRCTQATVSAARRMYGNTGEALNGVSTYSSRSKRHDDDDQRTTTHSRH